MKAFVFTDEKLREYSGQFVWLEIDIEKTQNAAFRKQFPVRALPTYLVLEPEDESVALRWVGGATVTKLAEILDGVLEQRTPNKVLSDASSVSMLADSLLFHADILYGANKGEEAASVYLEALHQGGADWPSYGRASEALLILQSVEGLCEDAVPFAREAYPHLAGTTSGAVVAGVGLDCALSLSSDDPDNPAQVEFFEEAVQRVLRDMSVPIAADDRSGLYISLYSSRIAAEDSLGARAVTEEWSTFLEGEAEAAKSPEARTVFDSHRLSAYLRLQQPERAIEMLESSASDFPEDYNPPARLAVAYKAMERWHEALSSVDEALYLAYGPRRVGLLKTRAQILLGVGRIDAARVTLEQALEVAKALPEGQRSERRITGVEAELEKLSNEGKGTH